MSKREWLGFAADAEPSHIKGTAQTFDAKQANDFLHRWDNYFPQLAHPGQLPPNGDWRVWLILAGRGFGKTRAGSEWVRSIAEADPCARIALIGASLGDVRSVMVEGESGVIACSPPYNRPKFEPSLHRLQWPNGAEALLYSAGEPRKNSPR